MAFFANEGRNYIRTGIIFIIRCSVMNESEELWNRTESQKWSPSAQTSYAAPLEEFRRGLHKIMFLKNSRSVKVRPLNFWPGELAWLNFWHRQRKQVIVIARTFGLIVYILGHTVQYNNHTHSTLCIYISKCWVILMNMMFWVFNRFAELLVTAQSYYYDCNK